MGLIKKNDIPRGGDSGNAYTKAETDALIGDKLNTLESGNIMVEVGKDRSNKSAYVCLVYAKNN